MYKFLQVESNELRDAIYKLRYKVYVEEFGFEKKEDYQDKYERDFYDENSIHLAALEEETNKVVGTVRLIFNSEKGFPIEHAAKTTFIGNKPFPDKIVEISRLVLDSKFRVKKTKGGILLDNKIISYKQLRIKRASIMFGLYQTVYQTSKKLGITHWYMIVEEKLYRLLKSYGFKFHQIGEPIQYHGIRIPYLGIISEIEQKCMENRPEFLMRLLAGLEKKYYPKKINVNSKISKGQV